MAATPPTLEQAMGAAIAAYNAGQADAAMRICQDILGLQPAEPAAHQLLALMQLQAGALNLARSHVHSSLQARAQHAPTLLLAGKIARAQNDLAAATDYLAQACALNPAHPESAYLLGLTLCERGQNAAAVTVLQSLVLQHPQHAAAWFQLGVARQDLGEMAAAVAAFQTTLQLQPRYVEAAVNLGIAQQETGALPAAMAAYGQAYRLRADTFGRIAQALTSSPHGALWLDLGALKATLAALPG
ncbi:MAG: tetratricopeptide repeat protein [Burkholderiales bacterium]|nr:tetratricopeptide repeat protein [Burkholderiales bacterium]